MVYVDEMNQAARTSRLTNSARRAIAAQQPNKYREKLLTVGARLFVEFGISRVSVDQLIEKAGISRATFYGCFANKHELAAAILSPVFESGMAVLSATMPKKPRTKAERLVDMYLELWDKHRDAMFLTSMVDSTVFPLIRESHDQFGVAILGILQAIQNAKLLRNDDAALSYRLLAKTGIPLLKLYQSHPEFEKIYRESMLAILLND